MSHPEQSRFIRLIRDLHSEFLVGARILDVGSYDVDGNSRDLFSSAREFVGIDLTPGPNVDIVLSGHDIDRTIVGVFDCVLSLEALEHDPLWRLTVENMIRVLNKPGLLIVTCASYQRPEHGTTRTTPGESPGTTSKNWDHYKNITEDDFVNHLKSIDPDLHVHTWYNKQVFDLYAIVFKSDLPDVLFTVPSAGEIDTILNSTPHLFKYARYPIRAIHSIFGDQLGSWFSRHYWTFLNRTLSSRVRGTRN